MGERVAHHGRWIAEASGTHHARPRPFAMLDALPDALVLVDSEGTITDVKPAQEVPLPPPEELIGQHAKVVVPVDRLEERLQAVLETGRPQAFDYEVPVSGRPRAREVRMKRLGEDQVLLVLRDTTEQRRVTLRELLTERMASLGALSAGVAHEINNPLAFLLANLEYAEDELDGTAAPEVRAALAAARQGAERMRTISGCLRIFARQEDDDVEQTCDAAHAVGLALEACAPDVAGRAQLTHEDRGAPPVRIHEARLAQVVINLIVNAAQSFDPAQALRNEIRVRTGSAEGRAVIEVADNGPGIPAAIRGRVFDPFFTTKPPAGRGLGLAVCEGIVRAAGGELEVESLAGLGTVFRVVLPGANPP